VLVGVLVGVSVGVMVGVFRCISGGICRSGSWRVGGRVRRGM